MVQLRGRTVPTASEISSEHVSPRTRSAQRSASLNPMIEDPRLQITVESYENVPPAIMSQEKASSRGFAKLRHKGKPRLSLAFDQRQYLCDGLGKLNDADMEKAVQIFRSGCTQFAEVNDDDKVFEIAEVNIETQHTLYDYIRTVFDRNKTTVLGGGLKLTERDDNTRVKSSVSLAFVQRQYMCDGLDKLNDTDMEGAVQIFRSGCPEFANVDDDDKLFEITEINTETQHKLYDFIRTVHGRSNITAIDDGLNLTGGDDDMRAREMDINHNVDVAPFQTTDSGMADPEGILTINRRALNGSGIANPPQPLQNQQTSYSENGEGTGVDKLPSAQSAAAYLAWLRERQTRWPTVCPNRSECVVIATRLSRSKERVKVFDEILFHWLLETDSRRGSWYKGNRLQVLGEDPVFDEVGLGSWGGLWGLRR